MFWSGKLASEFKCQVARIVTISALKGTPLVAHILVDDRQRGSADLVVSLVLICAGSRPCFGIRHLKQCRQLL